MSKNAFDVIIGADLKKFETDIENVQGTIKSIGEQYPIKLNLILTNKDDIIKDIDDISKLASTMNTMGSSVDTKGLANKFSEAGKSGKQAGSAIKSGMEEVNREVDSLSKSLDNSIRLMKEVERTTTNALGEKSTVKTKVTGNDYNKVTEKTENGAQKSIQTEINYEKVRTEEKKIQNNIIRDTEKIQEKINSLKQDGLVSENQVNNLQNDLNELTKSRGDSLSDQITYLEMVSSQYKEILESERSISFEKEKQDKIDSLNKKVDKNINADIIDNVDFAEIKDKIQEISQQTTTSGLEESIKNVDTLYDSILNKQKELISEQKSSESYEKFFINQEQKSDEFVNKQLNAMQKLRDESQNLNLTESERESVERRISEVKENMLRQQEQSVALTSDQRNALQQQLADIQNQAKVRSKANSQEEKERAKYIQQTSREANQLSRLQDSIEMKSYRASQAFKGSGAREEYKKASEQVAKINAELEKMHSLGGQAFTDQKNKVEGLVRQLDKMTVAGRAGVREREDSMFGRLGTAMKKIPVWMSAMTLFYGALRQVKQGFQDILDIDASMTDLRKVTTGTNQELRDFLDTASDIGYALGALTSDVIDATTEFQRLGFTMQESITLGRSALIYSNVGDVSIDESTSSIISTVKGFNIEVDSAGRNVEAVVDLYNEIGNKFAVSSAGIGEALQRSAATLHQAGNSIHESVALVASANASIQDPQKVGNALKTVAMRLRGVDEDGEAILGLVPQLEDMFNSFGATIMLDENTFKSTFEIMQTLRNHWENLADIERANIVETMGGKRQGAIISAMIENWEDAESAYEAGMNSAGSATEEMNQYMESMEYRINQLKVSMERFWVSFLDNESIKSAINLLTQVMNVLTSITDTLGGMNVGAVTLGTIGVLGSKSLREGIFQVEAYHKMMSNQEPYKVAQREIAKTSTEISVMNKTMSQGRVAFGRFGTGMQSLGKTVAHFSKGFIKITLIMTAISLTIQGLTALIKREENARKANIERLEDEITAYERLAEAKSTANYDEFITLHDRAGSLGVEELERYNTLQREIATHMPNLISHYDEYGNVILKTADSIRNLIEEEERLYALNQRELFEENIKDNDYSDIEKLVATAKREMDNSFMQGKKAEAYEAVEGFMKGQILGANLPEAELQKKAEEMLTLFSDSLGDEIDEFDKGLFVDLFDSMVVNSIKLGDIDGAYKGLEQMSESLRVATENSVKNVNEAKSKMVESMRSFEADINEQFKFLIGEQNIDVESNDFVFLNTLKNNILDNIEQFVEDGDIEGFIIEKFPEMIERAFEKMQTFDVSVNDLMNPTLNEQDIISSFQQVIDQMDDGSAEAREFVHALRLIRDQHVETSRTMRANPISFSWEENVQPHINNFINSIGDLDSAYKQLQEGQELTISQVFTLIEKYPELADSMKVVNGQIQINSKAIKDLASVKEVEFKRGLEIEKRKMQNAQTTARSNIQSLLQEAKAHEMLTEIKNKSVSAVMTDEVQGINARIEQINATGGMLGMSESQMKRERDRLIAHRDEIKSNLTTFKSAQTEIQRLESLLNFDFTKNLGGITSSSSSSSSKKKDTQKKELQDAMYIVDKFQKKMDELNYKIAVQQNLQTKYSNNSSGYRKHLQEEINLTIQKRNAIDAEIKSIQRQINNRKIEQKGLIQLGNTDNKTAKARNAELQQQIEEARSQMYNLRTESSSITTEINNLRFSLVESNIAIYNERRRQMEEELSYMDYSMGLYNEHSKAYENLGKAKVNSLKNVQKLHEQELGYLQTQLATNKNLTQQQKQQLEEMIDKVKMSIYSANQEVLSLEQSLQSLSLAKTLKKFDSEARNYEKTISSLRDELRYEVDEGEHSKEINNLTKIMGLYKGQVRDVKENIATLEAMRRQYQGNHALVTEITQEIENWKDRLVDTENSVKDVKLELEDVYQNMSDEYVELYKEQLTLLQRAEDDRYRKRMDAERKSHDQRMKHLDDELRKMEEIFDSQLDDLDREDAERTFNKELQKLQEEEQKIRSKQNELALDDSYRAKAEREKLEEDLKKTLEDIEELKYNRELDLRKQNIQDNKEEEQKKLEEKRESLQKEYDDFVESEENLKEERDKYWEDELNDERKFLKLREEVMAGSFDNMLNTVRSWTDNVKDNISELGTVITNNFTMKIDDAISALNSLNRMKVGSVTNQTNPDAINKNATKDYYGLEDRDAQGVGSLQTARTTSNVNIRTGAGTSNKSLGIVPKGEDLMIKDSKNGWSKVSWRGKTGWVSEKHIAKLDKGGITPKFKGGKVAMLHEEEMVANKVQTKDILRTAQVVEGLKDILPNSNKSQSRLVESLMDNIISGLNLSDVVKSLIPNKRVESKDKTVHNEYNMPIQVERFYGKKEDLEKLSEVVVTKMKRETGGNL